LQNNNHHVVFDKGETEKIFIPEWRELVEESSDAHAFANHKILDFLGDYNEEDISFLVLEECLHHVANEKLLVSLQISK
jgi:hypothetical protein